MMSPQTPVLLAKSKSETADDIIPTDSDETDQHKLHFLDENQIVETLIAQGFDLGDIKHGIDSIKARRSWQIGSYCSIYSRGKSKWFNAQIVDFIFDSETKQKLMLVRYDNYKKTKKIQRWNKNIRPMNMTHCIDKEIISFIANTLILAEPFAEYLSLDRMKSLSVKDKIDHRNEGGKFVGAVILEKNGSILKLQYEDDDEFVIDSDIKKDIGKYAEYGSISKRAAHRFLDLNDEDYIDINLGYYGDYNWRYGEIVDMDDESGQVQVGYMTADNEYNDIWIHLDNAEEAAECGTKANALEMIKQHIYDPFFNVKKSENQTIEILIIKLNECFDFISNEIVPQKKKESLLALTLFLNNVYSVLLNESICVEINGYMKRSEVEQLKKIFHEKYNPIVDDLRSGKDLFHVTLTQLHHKADALNQLDIEDLMDQIHQNKMSKIRAKWNMLTSTVHSNMDCKENDKNDHECQSIIRIQALLDIFEDHFKKETASSRDIWSIEEENHTLSNPAGFMDIYNKCIEPYYKIVALLNDFHHIQKYHMTKVISTEEIFEHCKLHKHKKCPLHEAYDRKKSALYDQYAETFEVNLIQRIVAIHVALTHKHTSKQSGIRINSEKFVTPIVTRSSTMDPINEDQSMTPLVNTANSRENSGVNILTAQMSQTSSRRGSAFGLNNLGRISSLQLQAMRTQSSRLLDTDTRPKKPVIHNFEFGTTFYYQSHFEKWFSYIPKRKYKNLKEETLQNTIFSLDRSAFDDHLTNAVNHFHCDTAKQLKSKWYGRDNDIFGVPAELGVTISHLLCIILYTDHSDLQYNYKKLGCRMSEEAKTLEALKKKNAEIGWWYTLLYESVLFWGELASKSKNKFYHGLNVKLYFSSFKPHFRTPISTTVEEQIARDFAENGIVLQLATNVSSQERCLDVEWISIHSRERERIFFTTNSLHIHDLRYKDVSDGRTFNKSNKLTMAAMQLFDYIFFVNVCYDRALLNEKVQTQLLKYLLQNLSAIKRFNVQNGIEYLNDVFDEEEYDTDCIHFDMQYARDDDDEEKEEKSFIFRHMRDEDDQKNESIMNMYNAIGTNHGYLQDLFNFMFNKAYKQKEMLLIESEYEQLNDRLRYILDDIIDDAKKKKKVKYTEQFDCRIEEKDFEEFMQSNEQSIDGTGMKGPLFSCTCNCDDGTEQQMLFEPKILRIDPSFPRHCSIGITVISLIPKQPASFVWSASVKEVGWASNTKSIKQSMIEGEFEQCLAFENKELYKVNAITLSIYIRPLSEQDLSNMTQTYSRQEK